MVEPAVQRRRRSLLQRAFVLRSDNVGRRVVSGAGYQFLGIFLRTALTIGSTAVLARLLTPADFGYVAMATVVTEFAALFGAFGFTNVLIQRTAVRRLQFDTVFWASLAIGATISAMVYGASFLAGWLFSDARVGPLLRVMCLNFLINSLSAVPAVVLARLMRFRTNFWINMTGLVIRTAVAVGCAVAGFGVWSLVVGGVVGAVFHVGLQFVCVPYLPRWRFHLPFLFATWRTSGGYLGNTLLYHLEMSMDILLIGRGLGAEALGYYQNARSFTDQIRARTAVPIQQVLFPAFASLQNDRERFQQLVLRVARMLAALVVPVGFGVSANAPELVRVLYGDQWLPMIPVMTMFGLSAALRASTALGQPLFNATDRVGLALRYNIIGTALLVVAVLVTMPYGIVAVSIGIALSSLYSLVTLRVAFGLIGLGSGHVFQVLAAPLAASAAMWAATDALRGLAWRAPSAALLAFHLTAGAIVYLASLHLLSRRYLQDVRQAGVLLRRKASA